MENGEMMRRGTASPKDNWTLHCGPLHHVEPVRVRLSGCYGVYSKAQVSGTVVSHADLE
jgi:hypothetical protein